MDALKVFGGFSMQVVGIALQQQTRSIRNSYKRSGMMRMASCIAEACVGVIWILLLFPSIFADPSLESAIASIDRQMFFGIKAG